MAESAEARAIRLEWERELDPRRRDALAKRWLALVDTTESGGGGGAGSGILDGGGPTSVYSGTATLNFGGPQ